MGSLKTSSPTIILNQAIAETYERWINSYYWEFARDCAYTTDDKYAAYGLDPVRKFPCDEPYVAYLYGKAWIKRRMSANKLRQALATNLLCVLRKLIFGLFIDGSSSYILKRAFNEADVILRTRIMNMYNNIPEKLEIRSFTHEIYKELEIVVNPARSNRDGYLEVNNIIRGYYNKGICKELLVTDENSKVIDIFYPKEILPIPRYTQGQITVERFTKTGKPLPPSFIYALEGSVEKARGITGSDGTVDEAAYTENLRRVYTAVSPAMEFLQMISSPRPSEFQKFFYSING